MRIFLLILFLSVNLMKSQDINISAPPPLKADEFDFPDYQVRYLSNALKVIIIENKKQPFLYFKMLIGGGNSAENIPGLAELTANMCPRGTKSKTAEEIADSMEFYGGSMSFNSSSDFISVSGSTLSKYLDNYLSLFSEVLVHPTFDDTEFSKLKKNFKSRLLSVKSNPKTLAGRLSQKMLFGDNHPYSKIPTDITVEKINNEDIKKFYNKYFIPNNATLAVIGDIEDDKLIDKLEEYFVDWEKGEKPVINIPNPKKNPNNMYFIERDSSKQTFVKTSILTCNYKDEDRIKLKIASRYLGDGFGGKLFKELREKYNYTYDPFAGITSTKFDNVFFCGAGVNNDSIVHSIEIINYELDELINHKVDSSELERIIKHYKGNFLLTLEDPYSIIDLILFYDFMHDKKFDLNNILKEINSVTPSDIQETAKKYFTANKRITTIVGDSAAKDNLINNFDILIYNKDMEEIGFNHIEYEINGNTPESIINNYIDKIGGNDAIDSVNSLTTFSKVKLLVDDVEYNGESLKKQKRPDLMYVDFSVGLIEQKTWVNENNVFLSYRNGQITEADSNQKEHYRNQAALFNIRNILDSNTISGFELENNNYIIKTNQSGIDFHYYFDENTKLLSKITMEQNNMISTIKYDSYKLIDNILLPDEEEFISGDTKILLHHNYKINDSFDEDTFIPY